MMADHPKSEVRGPKSTIGRPMASSSFDFCDSPEALGRALAARVPRPAAIVGVGSPLRGDDGFGPAVVAALGPCAMLRPFDVQAVPESFLVPIVESGCPGLVFVDAADLGAAPGRVAVVPAARLAEVDVSTHAIALSLVAEAVGRLAEEGGRKVAAVLLAAQPADLDEADRLSGPVAQAVRLAAEGLKVFAALPPVR
jgi:hydrogenase maturation protease